MRSELANTAPHQIRGAVDADEHLRSELTDRTIAVIVGVLGRLRLEVASGLVGVELTEADIDEIWWLWLGTFVGTGRRDGFLDRLDAGDAADAVRRLEPWVGETAALLYWFSVRPGREYRSRVIPVQAVLMAAIDRGVLNPTDTTARCAAVVGPGKPTRDGIDGDLLTTTEFVDDELWCAMTAAELGLTELRFGGVPTTGWSWSSCSSVGSMIRSVMCGCRICSMPCCGIGAPPALRSVPWVGLRPPRGAANPASETTGG